MRAELSSSINATQAKTVPPRPPKHNKEAGQNTSKREYHHVLSVKDGTTCVLAYTTEIYMRLWKMTKFCERREAPA